MLEARPRGWCAVTRSVSVSFVVVENPGTRPASIHQPFCICGFGGKGNEVRRAKGKTNNKQTQTKSERCAWRGEESVRVTCCGTKHARAERGPAGHPADSARFLLQLPLLRALRLGGAREARRVAREPLVRRRRRRVAPAHAHPGRRALHLEQLSAGRLQAGERVTRAVLFHRFRGRFRQKKQQQTNKLIYLHSIANEVCKNNKKAPMYITFQSRSTAVQPDPAA